ncbi:MAG: ATP-binding protein [Holophagales bacterium]|nr:ATP-binding protein [Holophagales bacterium]MYH26535.1 ATP-binding protein [Holophagales bacterium]
MKTLHRKRLGLAADPWAGFHLDTADAARTALLVEAAAEARLFVSVLGARGSGKTHAVRRALRRVPRVRVVEPLRLRRECLHIGDIEHAIVRELAPNDRPRRSGEARSVQVRRLLGQSAQTSRIVLVIDDAHVLHHATLRALKRLRELAWLGVSPLLGIVLVGQADRAEVVAEVGLRSDRLWLGGLLPEDAAAALERALNRRSGRKTVAPDAIVALAASPRARNWLDLAALVDDCLAEAAARGEDRITRAAALSVLHPDRRPAPDIEGPVSDDEAVADVLASLNAGERREAVA